MRFEVAGEGAPLILLRPLGGTIDLWGRFRDELVEKFRVISFDAPPRTTTREMATDAVALLDRVKVERAHVFGISLGGMVATWLAVDHPGRVERLVLASTMPWGLTARHASPRRAWSLARCIVLGEGERDACMVRRILSRDFVEKHPREVDRFAEIVRAHPTARASIVKLLTAAGRHDARASLHTIAADTLVIAGDRDGLASPQSQRWMAEQIPESRYELISAGHDLTLEAPALTAARVTAHFNR